MLEPCPIFWDKCSTFQPCAHSIPVYSIFKWQPLPKIRSYYPLFGKGCPIIRGAQFLEEIRYVSFKMCTLIVAHITHCAFVRGGALVFISYVHTFRLSPYGGLSWAVLWPSWSWGGPASAAAYVASGTTSSPLATKSTMNSLSTTL